LAFNDSAASSLLIRELPFATILPLVKGQQLIAFDEFGTSASSSRFAKDWGNNAGTAGRTETCLSNAGRDLQQWCVSIGPSAWSRTALLIPA